MSYNAAPLDKLIEEFSKFPGIGTKGATRMAYQVLSMSDDEAAALAGAIQAAHKALPVYSAASSSACLAFMSSCIFCA